MNIGDASQLSAKAERESTLNERLNKVGEKFAYQCDRIESVLSRINGTPQKGDAVAGNAPTPIRPTIGMQNMVENLESLSIRLESLRIGIERIA